MTQRDLNLMPESLRIKGRAGIVARRCLAGAAISIVVLIVLVTHSKFRLDAAAVQFDRAEVRADRVLAIEARASELRSLIAESDAFIDEYQQVASPLEISRLLATIVNELPPSITLDRVQMNTSARRPGPSARSKSKDLRQTHGPRLLTGEVVGFSARDKEITGLVARLGELEPFENVRLDFSRTCVVRERSAREFRVSFRIDLRQIYQVADRADQSLDADPQEHAHAGQ